VQTVWLVLGGALVAVNALAWILGRRGSQFADPVRLARFLVVYGVLAFAFGSFAIGSAREGGALFWSLAVACAVLAVAAIGLAAFVVWAWTATTRGDNSSA
jgi:hypothetical protein